MHHTYLYALFFLLTLSTLAAGCGSRGLGEDEQADTALVELKLVDTLRLKAGEIPANWDKIELPEGYYVGFPKKPNRQEALGHFVKYQLRQKQYALFFSHRDVSKDSSFAPNRGEITAYYHAIITDIADGLVLDDVKTEIVSESEFAFDNTHEGRQAHIKASDGVEIFTRVVIIGNILHTMGCVAWSAPSPEILQLKDRFFYTFGKELRIE